MSEKPLDEKELLKSFTMLKTNKSAGHDEVDVNVIKASYNELKEPLLFIFKLSLTQGVFPQQLKIARVVPIFKSGDANELGNYRPISILSVFSKILERIM